MTDETRQSPIFTAGQKVVCVDASLPANPWHRVFPLVHRKVYVVRALAGPYCIVIDGSGCAWQNWRFRPLVEREIDISVFIEILRKVSKPAKTSARAKWLISSQRPEGK